MKAKDFIKSRLSYISDKIPEIGIRYAYDKKTSFHIIEVHPESVRRGDNIYMEFEYCLLQEFHSLFPAEDLLISEIDSTNDMSNLIFEKRPADKMNVSNIGSDDLFSLVFTSHSNTEEIVNYFDYASIFTEYNEAA